MNEESFRTRVCVVVPAFNEATRLDLSVLGKFFASCANVDLLFVNDGSTDATLAVLESAATEYQRVRVISLEKNSGKAEAVRRGLLQAISEGYDLVGYWDADWATPLSDIIEFAEVLRRRPDVRLVLGSRVALLGRRIDRKWYRHYLGRVSATVASLVLGLPVYDTQCGAKLMRVSPEISVLFEKHFASGWVFDVEMLARYVNVFGGGEGIYELPLESWTDVGESKVRPIDFLRAFGAMARIYRTYRAPQRYRRALDIIMAPFVRYASAGAIGTFAHYATVVVAVEVAQLEPWVAAGLGATVGALINYFLNYHFIFASVQPHRATLPRFMVVATLSVCVNTFIVRCGEELGVFYLWSQVVATAMSLAIGYVLNRVWTFGERVS